MYIYLDEGVGKSLAAAFVTAEHDLAHASASLLQQQLTHLPHHVQPRPVFTHTHTQRERERERERECVCVCV